MPVRLVLKQGSQGSQVTALQEALARIGHKLDRNGVFDEPTLQAVLAFQKSRSLAADGVVGAQTWNALDVATPAPNSELLCNGVRVNFSTALRMCPGSPEANLRQNLPRVLKALEARALGTEAMIRMAIATIYVETGRFAPLSEFESKYNTAQEIGAHPFNLYDEREDLGNLGAPDGETFKGRGFIQLTGRANYEKYGRVLNVDLIAQPERANDPEIAARILTEYLKANEQKIDEALSRGDLAKARKLVNGGKHGLEAFERSYSAWAAKVA